MSFTQILLLLESFPCNLLFISYFDIPTWHFSLISNSNYFIQSFLEFITTIIIHIPQYALFYKRPQKLFNYLPNTYHPQ